MLKDSGRAALAVPRPAVFECAARTVQSLFDDAVREFAAETLLSWRGNRLSYAKADRLAWRFAGALVQAGVQRGDRVALCLPNGPAYPLVALATWRLGATIVGINPLYSAHSIQFQVENSGATAIVSNDDPVALEKISSITKAGAARLFTVAADGMDIFSTLAQHDSHSPWGGPDHDRKSVEIDPERDLAAIQYTGGTTGEPKGAALSHANLYINHFQLRSALPQLARGAVVMPVGVPLTHISGLQGGMIFVFGMGGHMILMERFDPGEMIALIEEQRVTHLGCVPTMMVAISAHPRARIADWSSVKAVMVGGAAAPAEVQARFQEITGVIVQPGYGATETSLGAVMGPADGDRDLDAAGQPLPGTTIEIRQTDDPSRIVDRGEIGEICVKGPQVMQGYWNRPDATAEAMIDGFFRTGDLGRIDNQGHVHIVDRLKDMIICSGYNVYPSAVENAIYRHPAILHCVVIAVPDEYRGETVKAYAVLRPDSAVTLEDLQAFLKPYLSPMEMPKLFEVRGTLPLTTAAKLSRKALRDELDSVGA